MPYFGIEGVSYHPDTNKEVYPVIQSRILSAYVGQMFDLEPSLDWKSSPKEGETLLVDGPDAPRVQARKVKDEWVPLDTEFSVRGLYRVRECRWIALPAQQPYEEEGPSYIFAEPIILFDESVPDDLKSLFGVRA